MMDSLMEDLAESQCRELLKTHHFGRVAFVEWWARRAAREEI
jgi:hypothetical protein